jgi:hypothetical protein
MSPPSAARSVRGLFFVQGSFSPNTPYQYSQYSDMVREIQNVMIEGETLACDWTFQVIKNYLLPGAKALFTMKNRGPTNEIVALALVVSSTAISQVSHLLVEIMIKERPNFDPSILYYDTCPNNGDFWKMLFGATVDIRLGLFHLLHQIVDTLLDPRPEDFWKCLVQLKQLVYWCNDNNLAGVLTSLKDRTFCRDNKKHSEKEITELRHSKRWKERCDPLLRKNIRPGPAIAQGISEWIDEWKDIKDKNGRVVFTRGTEDAAKEKMKKVQYVEDPQESRCTKRFLQERGGVNINCKNGSLTAHNRA